MNKKKNGLAACVFTFDPTPAVLFGLSDGKELTTREEKRRLFEHLGIDILIEFPLTKETAATEPERFVTEILAKQMNTRFVAAGEDLSFGKNGAGNAELLEKMAPQLGFCVRTIEKIEVDGIEVSSTYIRELLENGEVERANAFLGHPHTLSDTVHYGYRLGTKMGTPTINMQFPDGVLVPRHGVYAAKVYLDDGSEHYAVTNVGVRPTVSGGQRVSVESFILDYHGNLYNRQVRLEFYKFLRPERKFDSVDALKARILYDANTTRAYFEAQTQHA